MRVIKDIHELIEIRKNLHGKVGFVPTMGALHKGHLSLIEQSKKQNDVTIVSIFVNPTQFLEGEDFEKYPRKDVADMDICKRMDVDILFMPNHKDIYFEDEVCIKAPKNKSYILEGYKRPTHFDGVLRVVLKLFHLIKPNVAYFGKKDAQQLYLIKKMVLDLFLDIKIVAVDTVREESGLALSSRNEYLSHEDRKKALLISESLKHCAKSIMKGIFRVDILKAEMFDILKPLDIEYVEFVDRDFNTIESVQKQNSIVLVAVKVGTTRLIDNLWI
ncbi:MAG: pantoate--beta-alanine ligase [Campylobacterales bacterium]|nr:pantoate--beta-alanine ligase [Campylobacterales bacterium]